MTKPIEVADGLFFAESELVNWVIARDDTGLTLIDTGYPGQYGELLDSIRAIGNEPSDIRAVLITHAHVDHVGGAQRLRDTYGTPVYAHSDELAHLRREAHYAATPLDVARRIAAPGMLGWTAKAMRSGVLSRGGVRDPEPFGDLSALPGSPVPVLTVGHTPGHCGYFFPRQSALVTGDALVTAHPVMPECGPQLIAPFFDHDRAQAVRSVREFARVDASIVLPGHGPVHRGPVAEAVAHALNALERN